MRAWDDMPGRASAQVVEEMGQWVVYLLVTSWVFEDEPELRAARHRIDAYPTQRQAEIVAQWIARSANRDLGSNA